MIFGFCFHISREEFIIIDDLLTSDKKGEVMDRFFNYYLSKNYNSDVIYENHNLQYHNHQHHIHILHILFVP